MNYVLLLLTYLLPHIISPYMKFNPDIVAAQAFGAEFATQNLSPAQAQALLMQRFGTSKNNQVPA